MTRQTKRRSMLWSLFLTILAGRLNAQGKCGQSALGIGC